MEKRWFRVRKIAEIMTMVLFAVFLFLSSMSEVSLVVILLHAGGSHESHKNNDKGYLMLYCAYFGHEI